MSWDAILVKTTDTNSAKPADDAKYLPMGTAREVRSKLEDAVPAIQWWSSSEGHGYIGNLSIEFSLLGKTEGVNPPGMLKPLRDADQVETVGVSARGEGDPLTLVCNIAKKNHWSAADSQEGTWIDLNAPDQKSWQEFSGYRDRLTDAPPGQGLSSGTSMAMNILASLALLFVVALLVRQLRN